MLPSHRLLAVFSSLALLVGTPLTSQGALVLDLSNGGGSVVNYTFSGSTTLSAGFSVSNVSTGSSALRLPEDDNWSSYFTDGDFDDAGSELLNVTNVTSGIFAASGTPSLFIDGVQVEKEGGGFAVDGDWQVEFTSDPAFRFYIAGGIFDFTYPALAGGEVLTMSGSGSFNMGGGTFATNFNVGTYDFTGESGIETQINVIAEVAEPATLAILGVGIAGLIATRRRNPSHKGKQN